MFNNRNGNVRSHCCILLNYSIHSQQYAYFNAVTCLQGFIVKFYYCGNKSNEYSYLIFNNIITG